MIRKINLFNKVYDECLQVDRDKIENGWKKTDIIQLKYYNTILKEKLGTIEIGITLDIGMAMQLRDYLTEIIENKGGLG